MGTTFVPSAIPILPQNTAGGTTPITAAFRVPIQRVHSPVEPREGTWRSLRVRSAGKPMSRRVVVVGRSPSAKTPGDTSCRAPTIRPGSGAATLYGCLVPVGTWKFRRETNTFVRHAARSRPCENSSSSGNPAEFLPTWDGSLRPAFCATRDFDETFRSICRRWIESVPTIVGRLCTTTTTTIATTIEIATIEHSKATMLETITPVGLVRQIPILETAPSLASDAINRDTMPTPVQL
mmetsp:Transcript_5245/g.12901  ORF Transcript_5245/g.12901 Transcript_5245/m.12901 type:complete len:237 (+) Transcript_5245:306-1016(+)